MIPLDSFLLDPPMLVGSGFLADRLTGGLPPERQDEVLAATALVTTAGFWATSISLYLNARWTRWIWRMVRAESGRDWMLNSGLLRLEHENPSRLTHAASAAILATYPIWFALGVRASRRARR